MQNPRCKICRRLGVSVCGREKCALKRKPYPPGQKGKRRPRVLSEYGKQLREKQKLRSWYNLKERQFRKYVKEAFASRRKTEDIASLLIRTLESRLDSVIFRLGIAISRGQARQLVSHGHFLVNGNPVNIPSYQIKKGDVVSIKHQSLGKNAFQNLSLKLKKHKNPSWLTFDMKNTEGKALGEPVIEEVAPPVEISTIFEYYSR